MCTTTCVQECKLSSFQRAVVLTCTHLQNLAFSCTEMSQFGALEQSLNMVMHPDLKPYTLYPYTRTLKPITITKILIGFQCPLKAPRTKVALGLSPMTTATITATDTCFVQACGGGLPVETPWNSIEGRFLFSISLCSLFFSATLGFWSLGFLGLRVIRNSHILSSH